METHDIIVIGASAGGVEALMELVKGLPENFPAAVFVVLHIPAHGASVLPSILTRAGALPAFHAKDGMPIQAGCIHVAPPDFHLLLKDGHVRLVRGPKENGHRPAIDPMFRTAARAFGQRVIGVILSGTLDDGTAGLLAVKSRDGIAVVQDPEDAMYSGMPRSAVEHVNVDHILPLSQIADLLVRLVKEPLSQGEEEPVSDKMKIESDLAELEPMLLHSDHRAGTPASFACPDCGGTLWEIQDGDLIRFRCRVGHAFSPQTLLAEQGEALEEAFWIALRALEETAALSRRLAERARGRGQKRSAEHFEERARSEEEKAELVRRVLLNGVNNPRSEIKTDSESYVEPTASA